MNFFFWAKLLLVVMPGAVAKHGSCIFCNENITYDFSSLSNDTFTAHSGVKGAPSHSWRTYYVTSPCASVNTDNCVAGPTADPVAERPETAPMCQGQGSLAGVGKKLPKLSPDGSVGVNISLYSKNSACALVYRLLCDRTVSADNPPEPTIIHKKNQDKQCEQVVVTWKHPSACGGQPTPAGSCTQPSPPAPPPPVCKVCLPPWKPTWNMSRSTMLYACNASGMHSVAEAVRYGVVAYDWSNAKHLWVNAKPMNDQELLTKQAEMVLAADPGIKGEQPRVWVYRNKIKGLNWYSSVREKLDDPQYSGYFVKFKNYSGRASNNSYHVPACDWYGTKESPPKCSGFYHDQKQVPTRVGRGKRYSPGSAYCTPSCFHDAKGHSTNRSCINTCDDQCDCGPTNPCGEYTFDHRNASFSEWWLNEYMISKDTLLHDPMINLGWLDDRMDMHGMSEASAGWASDTGSSPEEMQDHVDAFRENIGKLQRKVVEMGGFYWQMVQGAGPQVSPVSESSHKHCNIPHPRNVTTAQCIQTLRTWCSNSTPAATLAQRYLQCPLAMQQPHLAESATAEFLLTRGAFAWIGYGWTGCAMEQHSPGTYVYPFGLPEFPRPALWDQDYGEAEGLCSETGKDSGVFVRQYPKAMVTWDCHAGSGTISRHHHPGKTSQPRRAH